MAIYCNTLEGNMQYGDDPYCFTPKLYVIIDIQLANNNLKNKLLFNLTL